jgi:hypothetical protein
MRTDKDIAFTLRKQGKSYSEISFELKVAKSTLSNWFRGVDFSEDIRVSLVDRAIAESTSRIIALNKIRGDSLHALYERAQQEAMHELAVYGINPLFIASVCAYWGEGDKVSKNHIRITNTDPQMILMFKEFLIKICGIPVEKLKLALFIYSDIDELESKKFWSENVGIKSFHKTMILPSRSKKRTLEHGICTLVLSNSYLKKKILLWIDQMPKFVLR